MVKLTGYLMSEQEASTSGRDCPVRDIFGIRPDKIGVRSFVRNFLYSVDDLNLIQRTDLGRETTMHTEDTTVHDSGEVEVIEDFHTVLPRVGVAILSKALFVETVHLRDLTTFVVAPDQSNMVWPPSWIRREREGVTEK